MIMSSKKDILTTLDILSAPHGKSAAMFINTQYDDYGSPYEVLVVDKALSALNIYKVYHKKYSND